MAAPSPMNISPTFSTVEKAKARSASVKSKRQSPWDTDEDAMWKKTAIRALRSVLPLQVEQALQVETEPGQLRPVDFDEAVAVDTETGEIIVDAEAEEVPNAEA